MHSSIKTFIYNYNKFSFKLFYQWIRISKYVELSSFSKYNSAGLEINKKAKKLM